MLTDRHITWLSGAVQVLNVKLCLSRLLCMQLPGRFLPPGMQQDQGGAGALLVADCAVCSGAQVLAILSIEIQHVRELIPVVDLHSHSYDYIPEETQHAWSVTIDAAIQQQTAWI